MPNVFVIIGDPNAGKSRTIRALTGVRRKGFALKLSEIND